MSLLQQPVKCLDQIDWYLNTRDKELFPGAFLLAAGNLARQLLEQILFVLAFYSGMPRNKYLKDTNHLRPVHVILKSLRENEIESDSTYLQLAAQRGSRVRKFARLARSFDRWRRLFNEPSHFVSAAAGRKMRDKHLREFTRRLRSVVEDVDSYLIIAAVVEIRSNGSITAVLGDEPDNLPGMQQTVVLTPRMFSYEDGTFKMSHEIRHIVVSKYEDIPYRWGKNMVFVQDSGGMSMGARYVTRSGRLLNLNNLEAVFQEFVNDPIDRPQFVRRMRRFGVTVHVSRQT